MSKTQQFFFITWVQKKTLWYFKVKSYSIFFLTNLRMTDENFSISNCHNSRTASGTSFFQILMKNDNYSTKLVEQHCCSYYLWWDDTRQSNHEKIGLYITHLKKTNCISPLLKIEMKGPKEIKDPMQIISICLKINFINISTK